jgi:sRNA-binding regulator protein Hfq
MSIQPLVPAFRNHAGLDPIMSHDRAPQPSTSQLRSRKGPLAPIPFHFPAQAAVEEGAHRQAELFYLQKQIHSQTPMVIVLEDGEHVEGCIEWYDRNSLKVRGRSKTLVYKSAIKYMYKLGEQGQ